MAYGCNFSKVVSILTKHMKLLPLQGAKLTALIPRVLPWARSFCPFRACGANHYRACGAISLERVRESDRHELLELPIALIILTLRSIIETRIEEDIR